MTSFGTKRITHPERNPLLVQRPERILELIDAGALVQLTANSITGFWGTKARSISEWLLRQGAVHVVASNVHDSRRHRPVLSEARLTITKLAGGDVAENLMLNNPQAIIDGHPLHAF
jgi:protein-tyrosine phosphatase